MTRDTVPHLPLGPRDPAAYQQLYAEMTSGVDGFGPNGPWFDIRIPRGLSARAVYRRLPNDPSFEYGGYLTKTRIRYCVGTETSAETVFSKRCTFHSHPTNHPLADVPSPVDVYQFLKWRQLRAILVGNFWIWVWDKTGATLRTVQRLLAWESVNMVSEMRRLSSKHPQGFCHRYQRKALREIGMSWSGWEHLRPDDRRRLLRDALGIRTALIPRGGE